MSISGFLYWTRTADRGLHLFGMVFALVISGKLLCRWGWLFRWLWRRKQGEGTVLYPWIFPHTHQKDCPLKLTTGTPTVQFHCQQNVNAFAAQQTGWRAGRGVSGRLSCPTSEPLWGRLWGSSLAGRIAARAQLLLSLWSWQPESQVDCSAAIPRHINSAIPCSQHDLREAILLTRGSGISWYD